MTKKAKQIEETATATFTFSAEKKHSWLYKEEGDNPLMRSIYLGKGRFPQKPGNQIVILIKAL